MKKTDKWYKGNRGLVKGRSAREASIAGKYNPKCKTVSCIGCGKDTENPSCLCDECETCDY